MLLVPHFHGATAVPIIPLLQLFQFPTTVPRGWSPRPTRSTPHLVPTKGRDASIKGHPAQVFLRQVTGRQVGAFRLGRRRLVAEGLPTHRDTKDLEPLRGRQLLHTLGRRRIHVLGPDGRMLKDGADPGVAVGQNDFGGDGATLEDGRPVDPTPRGQTHRATTRTKAGRCVSGDGQDLGFHGVKAGGAIGSLGAHDKGLRVLDDLVRGRVQVELVARLGKKWSTIQGKLHRSADSCRDKYREMSDEYTKGRWKEQETEVLERLIREQLGAEPGTSMRALGKLVEEQGVQVPWSTISKRMVKRSRLSCFKKWQKLTGLFSLSDDHRSKAELLEAIAEDIKGNSEKGRDAKRAKIENDPTASFPQARPKWRMKPSKVRSLLRHVCTPTRRFDKHLAVAPLLTLWIYISLFLRTAVGLPELSPAIDPTNFRYTPAETLPAMAYRDGRYVLAAHDHTLSSNGWRWRFSLPHVVGFWYKATQRVRLWYKSTYAVFLPSLHKNRCTPHVGWTGEAGGWGVHPGIE
jgi:hypothetical protein